MEHEKSARDTAIRAVEIMAAGSIEDFSKVFAADAINHESDVESMAARACGPDAFFAAALWLRGAFSDLHWRIDRVAAEGDLVAIQTVQSGRHTAPFVLYDEQGTISTVRVATFKTFAVRQTHWYRIRAGLVVEHWADRDDLGQGLQLGWIPPTPIYLWRCAREKRRLLKARR